MCQRRKPSSLLNMYPEVAMTRKYVLSLEVAGIDGMASCPAFEANGPNLFEASRYRHSRHGDQDYS